jgi:trk system potassium uptake protein TrkH
MVVSATGAVMLVPALYSLLTGNEGLASFGIPSLAALTLGALLFYLNRVPEPHVSIRDVFLIVVLGWLAAALTGALPFYLSGLMTPVEAFFEAMAGITTTGASTVETVEEVAPSLLLWRSLSQWFGGIGIIVLFIAVGPLVGLGAGQLYSAEMANPIPERITPRISQTAKYLAYVYLALTLGGIATLMLVGMSPFDAVNHALTTVSTGGYSTRSESIAAFDSAAVEIAIMAGMLLSGSNFALYFLAAQGRFRRVLGNQELLTYLGLFLVGTLLVSISLYAGFHRGDAPLSLRSAAFHTATFLTGTAFTTQNWGVFGAFPHVLLLVFMAIGGCAGSTTGGLKVVRVLLLCRHAAQEAIQMLHPQAVTQLKLGSRPIPDRMRISFLGFFFVYVVVLVAGSGVLALHGIPAGEAFGAAFASLNLTGTALGAVGDATFYAALPATAKITLNALMLLGRLELFTVLVLVSPAFWKR